MEEVYRRLQKKCDQIGIGFPATEKGFELNYLKELFTPEEAEFFLKMEDGYQTPEEVARSMGEDVKTVTERVVSMAKRGLLFRIHDGDVVKYRTIPVIHGFYEFNPNRLNATIAKNFSKHFITNMGENFHKHEDPVFRVLPINVEVVTNRTVLPIDDALAIIERQDKIAVTDCFCRMVGRLGPSGGCDNPLETCILFNTFAEYYVENGIGRYISKQEAIDIIKQSDELGLVREVSNSEAVEVMCSCCSCCCGVMNATKLFRGIANEVMSNYYCSKTDELCINCGRCAERCPVNAQKLEEGKAIYDRSKCIGCGLCVTTCPTKALTLLMKEAEDIYLPPAPTLMDTYDLLTEKRKKQKDA